MPEHNDGNELPDDVRCESCDYPLQGLDAASACPECGFSIAQSSSTAVDRRKAGEELPRIELAMFLLLCSTLAGIPAIIAYALPVMNLFGIAGTSSGWTSRGFQVLVMLGCWLPVLTMSCLPRRLHRSGGIARTVVWGVVGVVGMVLVNLPGSALFVVGAALGAAAVVLNLTRANRTVGLVVPAWQRLGPARQRRGPLLTAIVLVALVRLYLLGALTGGTGLMFAWTTVWLNFVKLGLEALLIVGGIYLFFNRLWLLGRLWRSMRLRPSPAD